MPSEVPKGDDASDATVKRPKDLPFPVVGVGASAGGLEAFTEFLRSLPVDTDMAFVLVQHLTPSHPSSLSEILSRATRMTVTEVQDEPEVEPNCVYVIPPDRSMIIADGALHLLPRDVGGAPRPIDKFFRSLAEEQGAFAIGVVLSGTATDGTIGLEAIKGEGGITFAQDDSAQHRGMPQSAVASGCVDFVLSPREIATEIARIGRHLGEPEKPEDDAALGEVLQLLHRTTGVDFTHYKRSTLRRRIMRRRMLKKLDHAADYARALRDDPAELQALYRDVLISVTSFFRNPEVFEALKNSVFPRIIEGRSGREPVRIWSVGCSTGQEAYSLAIAYAEFREAADCSIPLQLFATDLNPTGVDQARTGLYSKDAVADVSPERLARFFTESDGGFRVRKEIREGCIFAPHNVLVDPPFSRIDLISCRNFLIYLESPLQEKVITTLHYALNPEGILVLGPSEALGRYRSLFEAQDGKRRIYKRKPAEGSTLVRTRRSGAAAGAHAPLPGVPEKPIDLYKEGDRVLAARFSPPGVLVSADMEILQFRGDMSPYLRPSPGRASLSLLKMVRKDLLVPVRSAVKRARNESATVRQEAVTVKSENGERNVALEVIPIRGRAPAESGFLILFNDGTQPGAIDAPAAEPPAEHDVVHELEETREFLQSLIEQQEVDNEALQSANEEAQSANEELQSANEELETSKEEIQSANEELATLNDELNNRNVELERLNRDLTSLLGNIRTAIVLLDSDLKIRRLTRSAEESLHLATTDIGRRITDISLHLTGLSDLNISLREALESGGVRDFAVRDEAEHRYRLRVLPTRSGDGRVDGVVLMLVDVDALTRQYEYLSSILETASEPMMVLDSELRVRAASGGFYRTFGMKPDEILGKTLGGLGDGQWDVPMFQALLERLLVGGEPVLGFELENEVPGLGRRTMRLNATRLRQSADLPEEILLTIDDVTAQKGREDALRARADELSEADHRKSEFLAVLSHELRNPLAPIEHALEIIRRARGDPETERSAYQTIRRQVGHMVRLVDDLIDESRITRGKIELRLERIEITPAVEEAVNASRASCAKKSIDLRFEPPPVPVFVVADATRLGQMVGNLVNNSCKFTKRGGLVSVTVAQAGGDAEIRVRDTGIGIASQDLPRVFDLYMQVSHHQGRSKAGLGIGLSLVRSLAHLHGGSVEAYSAGLGQGSEFVLKFPIAPEPTVPARWLQKSEATSEPSAEPGTEVPRRVLIVDDNRDAAETLAALLKMMGHETSTAYDGESAMDVAASFLPEVVLLDIGLPRMSGYDVARAIRAQPWGKKILLVALTGWGQQEDREESEAAGFDLHLVKPVPPAKLVRVLAELPIN